MFWQHENTSIAWPFDMPCDGTSFAEAPSWEIEVVNVADRPVVLEGDFYREEEGCRCMGCGSDVGRCSQDSELGRVCYHSVMHEAQPEVEPHAGLAQQHWFATGDIPSSLPLDLLRVANANMIHVDNSIPAAVFGNRLIAFLQAEAEVSVAKLDRSKFSVTVRAHFQGYALELCVRVYALQISLAAEFQRRSGDVLAFCRFRRYVARRFRESFQSGADATLRSANGVRAILVLERELGPLFPELSESWLEYGSRARDALLSHRGVGGIGRACERSIRGAAALCAGSARCFRAPAGSKSELQDTCCV